MPKCGRLWRLIARSRTHLPIRIPHRAKPARVEVAVFGGKRWWFLCPIVRRDGKPPRRVAKLHLPRGARYFGSRRAYDLTYTSCRESGQFRSLFARMGADVLDRVRSVKACCTIANAGLGKDQLRLRRVLLQLLAKLPDEDTQVLCVGIVRWPPNLG